jgi:hypothetical protein
MNVDYPEESLIRGTLFTQLTLPRAISESMGSFVLGPLRFATSHLKVDMSPVRSVVPTEVSVNDHRSSRNRAVKMHETLREAISMEQE